MSTLDTNLGIMQKLIGKKISIEELRKVLFEIGMELKCVDEDELKIEITPERYDMISPQGLARALKAYLGIEKGLPEYKIYEFGSSLKVEKTIDIWPYSVAFVVKNIGFNNEKIKEVIQLQEKLGDIYLKSRKKGGIGIYPLEKIKFPITFTTEKPEKIKFRPLESTKEMNGWEILENHPTGQKYGYILKNQKEFPVFIDARGTIMSMPPIINSADVGKIDETTKDIFIEVTGPELNRLLSVVSILATTFSDMGGKIYSLEIIYPTQKMTIPDLNPVKVSVDVEKANRVLGLNLNTEKAAELLERMMYKIQKIKDNKIELLAPAFRSDFWSEIDIIDDIGRAYGYNNFKPQLPKVAGIGGNLPITDFKEDIANFLIGFGLQEIKTFHLANEEEQYKKMNIREEPHISINDAVQKSISMLRTWLIPNCLKSITCNIKKSYPQNFFEIGLVTVPDKEKDVQSTDILKLVVSCSHQSANFTEIAQILDVLFRALNLKYQLSETEHGSFIPGRVAKILIGGKEVGIMGEIHPQVLENWGLEMPVSAFEIDLEKVFEEVSKV